MKAFFYGILLQWKLDLRDKGVLLTYYVVPLVFFAFMGGVFTSVTPEAKDTLIASMTVFGVTMGAIVGAPHSLVEFYGGEVKKSYQAGGVPLWINAVNNLLSAFIHMFIMSTVILLTAPLIFDAPLPTHFEVYFLSLAVFIITSLTVSTVLGVFIKSTGKLTMFSQFIFLPSIMLSGIMFPVDMLPEAFGSVGKLFPATWAFIAMQEKTLNIEAFLPLIIITAVAAAVVVWRISRLSITKTVGKKTA